MMIVVVVLIHSFYIQQRPLELIILLLVLMTVVITIISERIVSLLRRPEVQMIIRLQQVRVVLSQLVVQRQVILKLLEIKIGSLSL